MMEIELVSSLEHPNIVRLKGMFCYSSRFDASPTAFS